MSEAAAVLLEPLYAYLHRLLTFRARECNRAIKKPSAVGFDFPPSLKIAIARTGVRACVDLIIAVLKNIDF